MMEREMENENFRRQFSHKGEKVCSYTVAFKLEVIFYAEQSTNHAAGKRYNVSRSCVRDWRKKKQQLEEMMMLTSTGARRRRLNGGGRKIVDTTTEKTLVEWVLERNRQGLRTPGTLIIKKAQSLQQDKEDKSTTLSYSRGWLEKFLKRNGLSLKTTSNPPPPMMCKPRTSFYEDYLNNSLYNGLTHAGRGLEDYARINTMQVM